MFARRGDRERPHLDWRVRLFVASALLAMVGMGMGVSWLVWIALGLLILAVVLRHLPGGGGDAESTEVDLADDAPHGDGV